MKALKLFLFTFTAILFLQVGNLSAQNCEYWSEPQPLSDSLSDNQNAMLVNIPANSADYYVFWERLMDDPGSEIVYIDVYNQDVPQRVVFGDGFKVTNPQVIPVMDFNPPEDTLAFVFYETNQSGNEDIYYVVMKDTGFTAPAPFATSPVDESHFRVSTGGGMVWQEGYIIRFCRLSRDNSGFYFEPVVTIDDEAENQNPDIQNTDHYSAEQYIAWEKGAPDSTETWYSYWSYDNDEWSEPVLLFGDGDHSNLRFSTGIEGFSSAFPILVSDKTDSTGQFLISGYDFYFQDEFVSGFTQSEAFQPDLFTIDLITADYWDMGYLTFSHEEEGNNSDIFSSDEGFLLPEFSNYCRIDSTQQTDAYPQLFMGAWHGNYFDLFCIWESWHNGHWQLFSATIPVVVGNVPDQTSEGDLKVMAYPNPFDDFLWLEYESRKTWVVNVTIFNTFGQVIKTIDEGYSSKEKMMKKIDMKDVPAGIYLVRIEAGNSVNCIKLIKK